ncbi:cytochrome P450 [Nonomuraea sp. NPDC023979]|uniref:cytochrome P450 n=1 Tax=Nonomuraea sp. NPDC023979 TaxID=3154796 RepID=UPI0033C978DA
MRDLTRDIDSLPFLDVYSADYVSDPLGMIEALGPGVPVARSPRGVEFLSYDLARALLRDERFTVGFAELLTACGLNRGNVAYRYSVANTAALEGEAHRRQRRLLGPLLGPVVIERSRGVARLIAAGLLDSLAGDEFDFAKAVAPHVPAAYFCHLIGAPAEDHELVAACSDMLLKAFRADPRHRDEIERGARTLVGYARAHIERRRAEPGDDVLSQLLVAERRGETTTEEILEILFTLLTASTDNTSAALSHTVMALAAHPDQWRLLREDPTLIPSAVQESLRARPNVWSDPRLGSADQEFAGLAIPSGTWLFASVIAANHDPSVFTDPKRFRISRTHPRPVLNFGSGRHACLGRLIALIEIEETVRLLVERFAKIEVTGPVVRDGQPHGDFVRALPVRLTPARPGSR